MKYSVNVSEINRFLKRNQFVFILTFLLFLSVSAHSGNMNQLRNQRYCEIILGDEKTFSNQLKVYNTIGLNNCPENLWSKITEKEIKKETDASYVHLNGPRYWTIDGLQNSALINPEPKILGGIAMREAGILKLDFIDLLTNDKPYKKHTVHRETTWVYNSGKPIYELINPENELFVMQSYSTQKIKQTQENLSQLGSTLQLPKDWKFRTRILKQDGHLTPSNQEAVVIQDDNLNTYQQENPAFIAETRSE